MKKRSFYQEEKRRGQEEKRRGQEEKRRGQGAGIQRSWILKTLVIGNPKDFQTPILAAKTSPESTDSSLQTDEPAVSPDTPFSSSNRVSSSLSLLEFVEPQLSP